MSLLFIDGFDWLSTSTGQNCGDALAYKYDRGASANNVFQTAAGATPGETSGAILMGSSAGATLTSPLFTGVSTVVWGGNFKVDTLDDRTVVNLNEGTTLHLQIRITAAGELRAMRAGTTEIGITSGLGLAGGAWYYIEVKAVIHDSTGAVTVQVGGSPVLTLTSQDTRNGGSGLITNFSYVNSSVSNKVYYDNVYCLNTSGSVNNDFLGPQVVKTIRPSSDVTPNDWTVGSGSDHFAGANEDVISGTNYIEDDTAAQRELFGLTDLVGVADIKGIQINSVTRVTTGTAFNLKNVLKSGSTTDVSSASSITSTSYSTKKTIYETNPDTAVAWVDADIDALQTGVEVG